MPRRSRFDADTATLAREMIVGSADSSSLQARARRRIALPDRRVRRRGQVDFARRKRPHGTNVARQLGDSSPTSGSPPPSAPPTVGSLRARHDVGADCSDTSICARSAADASAGSCPASRSSRPGTAGDGPDAAPLGQAASLRLGQPHSPACELASSGSIFFNQVGDHLLLLGRQPAGHRGRETIGRRRRPSRRESTSTTERRTAPALG